MNRLLTTAAIAVLAAAIALGHDAIAQNAPAANPHPSTPAIAAPMRTTREHLLPERTALPRPRRNPASRQPATPTFRV